MSVVIKVEIDGVLLTIPVSNNAKVIVEGLESFENEPVELHYNITHEGMITDLCGTVEGRLEIIDSEWSNHNSVIARLEPEDDGDDD